MKKLVFAINMSLDGFCDHTRFSPDEETMEYFTQLTREADTLLYGRKTYQLMVPYWPEVARNATGGTDRKADIEFARAFNAVDNILVFSKSLKPPGTQKTKIVRTGLGKEILQIKREQGKNILTGGVSLPAQLAALGLIDDYHLIIHPIIIGAGPRLFEGINLQDKLQVKLTESKVFHSGVVALHYQQLQR